MKKKYAVKDLESHEYYHVKYGWGNEAAFGIAATFETLEDAEAFIESQGGGFYTIETIYIP